jgi:hypothetical protein
LVLSRKPGLAEPHIVHSRVHAALISENKDGVFTSESTKLVGDGCELDAGGLQ